MFLVLRGRFCQSINPLWFWLFAYPLTSLALQQRPSAERHVLDAIWEGASPAPVASNRFTIPISSAISKASLKGHHKHRMIIPSGSDSESSSCSSNSDLPLQCLIDKPTTTPFSSSRFRGYCFLLFVDLRPSHSSAASQAWSCG
jgi:hypothetical protein